MIVRFRPDLGRFCRPFLQTMHIMDLVRRDKLSAGHGTPAQKAQYWPSRSWLIHLFRLELERGPRPLSAKAPARRKGIEWARRLSSLAGLSIARRPGDVGPGGHPMVCAATAIHARMIGPRATHSLTEPTRRSISAPTIAGF